MPVCIVTFLIGNFQWLPLPCPLPKGLTHSLSWCTTPTARILVHLSMSYSTAQYADFLTWPELLSIPQKVVGISVLALPSPPEHPSPLQPPEQDNF